MNYQTVIDLIVEQGDQLPSLAGKIADIGVKKKWLTEKDIVIEQALTAQIRSLPGEQQVFAEELHSNFQAAENVWIMDPISSTSSFISGLPFYSIVVAHLVAGEVRFGAVYNPSHHELFTAEKGKGAFLNGKRIQVSTRDDLTVIFPPYVVIGASTYDQIITTTGKLLQAGATLRNFGSFGLHYAYLACGRVTGVVHYNIDVFPEFAGKLLIEEAGGLLTDFQGRELAINSHGILASTPATREKLLNIVKDQP